MKPTVGRIVHFYTDNKARHSNGVDAGPYPAIITRVWSEKSVNLKVLPDCGAPFDATSTELKQEGRQTYWEWPPHV